MSDDLTTAGGTPQEPSAVTDINGHSWMTWEESGKNGTYCRSCGGWAGKVGNRQCSSAPELPSSGVDEDRKHDNVKRRSQRVIAERDAALAVLERVRAIAERHGMKPWTEEIFAALDGAPEPTWEYGVEVAGDVAVRKREVAERASASADYATLVRRRPAGPWIQVEGESRP